MITRSLQTITGILFLLAIAGLLAAPVHAGPSNKWRIEVSEGANSDGEIVFLIKPIGAEAIEVRVSVKDGTGENVVAETIGNALKAQLPGDGYHVEVDDSEDVLVKANKGPADFDLILVGNTVKSVRINLDRE
jgi:hypothetical protein